MNLILLGPPGAGKGTQARILVEKRNFDQIATGDLLRNEIRNQTVLGNKVKSIIESGGLVDDNTMIDLISNYLYASNNKQFIFDGFPRTIAQAIALDKLLHKHNMQLDAVIKLGVDDDILVKRISGRYNCSTCGAGYHDFFQKPTIDGVCNNCKSTHFSRRKDDTEDTVRSRLKSYHNITDPLTDYYDSRNKLHQINGMADVISISSEINQITDQYCN